MPSLNIHVVGSSGKGVKARYSGKGKGFIGGSIEGGYTNSDGHGYLSWNEGSSIASIYIDGKEHKGPFRSGETYSFRK